MTNNNNIDLYFWIGEDADSDEIEQLTEQEFKKRVEEERAKALEADSDAEPELPFDTKCPICGDEKGEC